MAADGGCCPTLPSCLLPTSKKRRKQAVRYPDQGMRHNGIAATGMVPAFEWAQADPANPVQWLSEDTWRIVLGSLLESGDPWEAAAKLCRMCSAPWWKDGCGANGFVWDEANRRRGWYGRFTNWNQVHTYYSTSYTAPPSPHPTQDLPQNPKAYFIAACKARDWVNSWLQQANDGTGVVRVLALGEHPYTTMLLKLAVVLNAGRALKYVPVDREDFGELARVAFLARPSHALQYVPTYRDDYGKLAELSVRAHDYTIRYVPTYRDDYGKLAKIAMQARTGGTSLGDVPTDRDDYGEIAEIGVQTWLAAIRWVPTNRPDYQHLAVLAVRANQYALRYVPEAMRETVRAAAAAA